MPRIVVAGVASLYFAAGIGEFPLENSGESRPDWITAGVAGSASHAAKILAALGDQVTLCTLAGSDLAGRAVKADIQAHGLPADGVVDAGATSLGVTLVASDGSRLGLPYTAAVNAVGYPVPMFRRLAAGSDLAVLTRARFTRPLISCARQLGVPVATDVHVIADARDPASRPWMEAADILFCSHERLPCPPPEWMAQVFARYPGCEVVGVGRGMAGADLGLRDGTLVRAAAVAPRGVVNTSGAGDTLFASFLHAWLATGNPVAALRAGVLHAGWRIGDPAPGAGPLSEEELARLSQAHQVRMTVGSWLTVGAGGRARPGGRRSAPPVASPG
jgi:sugar/nucleoside kinase (ribokinase family)